MKLTPERIQGFMPLFKNYFLKGFMDENEVLLILQNADVIEHHKGSIIFQQDDAISAYYFLIKGVVGMYGLPFKKQRIAGQQMEIFQSQCVIGEYFNSHNLKRGKNAKVISEGCQIVTVAKSLFDSKCSSFIDLFLQAEKYAKNVLKIPKKVNFLETFNVRSYRLGNTIQLVGQMGCIIQGQCKISAKTKKMVEKGQKQPQKGIFPPILMKKIEVKREIALVQQNQWIYTQNLPEKGDEDFQFKYTVASEGLSLLTLGTGLINVLPESKVHFLSKIQEERRERAKMAQRISFLEESRKGEKQNTSPKRIFSNKAEDMQQILQKIDPNLSPNAILKKYKLGYNSIRHENREQSRINESLLEGELLRKERSERLIKKSYYKVKDWSKYIKRSKGLQEY